MLAQVTGIAILQEFGEKDSSLPPVTQVWVILSDFYYTLFT
jgi:hypothetical protein